MLIEIFGTVTVAARRLEGLIERLEHVAVVIDHLVGSIIQRFLSNSDV